MSSYCKQGHLWEDENILWRKSRKGEVIWRRCKKCKHEADAKDSKTRRHETCKNGHAREGNTKIYITKEGKTLRICMVCRRENARTYTPVAPVEDRNRVAVLARQALLANAEDPTEIADLLLLIPIGTHCNKGHEYTEENTAFRQSQGKRRRICRKCRAEALRKHRDKLERNLLAVDYTAPTNDGYELGADHPVVPVVY